MHETYMSRWWNDYNLVAELYKQDEKYLFYYQGQTHQVSKKAAHKLVSSQYTTFEDLIKNDYI